MSSVFPACYRDVSAWRSSGLPLSSTSDEAARSLDAALAQLAFAADDAAVGGLEATMDRMTQADPDCVLARAFKLQLEAMESNVLKNTDTTKKIFDLKQHAIKSKASKWELSHVEVACHLSRNDYTSACREWESILVEHPNDMLALHLLYFGHFHMGRRRGLRDVVAAVVKHYKPSDRYYGNVYGKLCFGYEENRQFSLAESAGRTALAHSPADIWTVHSMAHVFEETDRASTGLSFLHENESTFASNHHLGLHMWWHNALFLYQNNDLEAANTLLVDNILPTAVKMKAPFPLSDATSLLLRLEMDSVRGLEPLWARAAEAYSGLADLSSNNLFYDLHALIGLLFGGRGDEAERLKASLRDQAEAYRDGRAKDSQNCMVVRRLGEAVVAAIEAYHDKDYATAASVLHPVRYDWHDLLGGSHTQKDLLDLMLLTSAVRSGNAALAGQLFAERTAASEGGVTATPIGKSVAGRFMARIAAAH